MAGQSHPSRSDGGAWQAHGPVGLLLAFLIAGAQAVLYLWISARAQQTVSAVAYANGADIWWIDIRLLFSAGVMGSAFLAIVLLPATFGMRGGGPHIPYLGPLRYWAVAAVLGLAIPVDVAVALSPPKGGYATPGGRCGQARAAKPFAVPGRRRSSRQGA